jgi:hypothetical protein
MSTPASQFRGKCWGGTLNNPTPADAEFVKQFSTESHIRYCVACTEVGDCGTEHIQLAFSSKNNLTQSALTKKFGKRWHWDKYGKFTEYPLKHDSVVIVNVKPVSTQGARTDLTKAHAALLAGTDRTQFRDEHFSVYAKYANLHKRFFQDGMQHRNPDQPPMVVWLSGPSGSGKSRCIMDMVKGVIGGAYIHSPDGRWWDMYNQQPVVVIDEYRVKDYDWAFTLRLTDRYPFSVPTRGLAPIPFNSPLIVFTCVADPREAHQHHTGEGSWDTDGQLLRRITHEWDMRVDDPATCQTLMLKHLVAVGARGFTPAPEVVIE